MATMGPGIPWGGPQYGDSGMAPVASNYSGAGHASVSHSGHLENGLSFEYPISSSHHNLSTFSFDHASHGNSYHDPNQPLSTPGDEHEHSPAQYIQQDISPMIASFTPHQHQGTCLPYQDTHHEQHSQRPPFIQTHSFRSDHHSSSYSGTPGADDGPEMNTNESVYSQAIAHASQFSPLSRAINASSAILSPVSVPVPQVSNDHAIGYHGNMSKQQAQHERTRQKNRMAASKCREKSKKTTNDLRIRERELAAQKQILTACAADLKDEVLALKHEILRHANCDCQYIQNYLTTAASQIS